MTISKKAKPTQESIRASKRIKAAWLKIPRDRRPTQDQLAASYGEGGDQSLMSQYLNGTIPLNVRAVWFFARQLGVSPLELYPELPGLDDAPDLEATLTEADLDREWQQFAPELKAQLLRTVRLVRVR